MKKLILSMAVIATLAASVASCKKAVDAVNCADAQSKLTAAASAYSSAQTKANCDAYKAAITSYLGTSCATAEQKATLQEFATLLTCQ
jgi:hypothetical protein